MDFFQADKMLICLKSLHFRESSDAALLAALLKRKSLGRIPLMA